MPTGYGLPAAICDLPLNTQCPVLVTHRDRPPCFPLLPMEAKEPSPLLLWQHYDVVYHRALSAVRGPVQHHPVEVHGA
jgi:hypothetical protein